MPTAKFEADFSSFLTAIDAAVFKLADLSKGSDKVQKQLDAMSDQFSGRALIQEASLMTIAVEKLGGVSKLTAAELETVGAKAAQAVEKMKALGYDVPAGLENLAKATQANAQASSNWSTSLQTLTGVLGAFGIDASIRGVIQFGQAILETADKVQKMSDQTGISAENIQRMQYIASQTGTSMSSMVSAVQNMQEKLGSGDKNLNKALADLGISLDHIKSLDAYSAFTEIADAIGAIADPTRQAADAQDAFGRNWKELLPAIKAGMQEVGREAATMSDETIAKLDAIGDEWEALKQRIVVIGGEVIAAGENFGEKFAKNFEVNPLYKMYQAAELAHSAIEQLVVPIDDVIARQNALDRATANYAAKLPAALKPAQDAWAALAESEAAQGKIDAERQKSTDQWAALMGRVAAATADTQTVLEGLDGTVVEGAKALNDLGVAWKDIGELYGLTETQIRALERAHKDDEKAAKDHAKAIADGLKAAEAEAKNLLDGYNELQKKKKEYDDLELQQTTDATTYKITKIWQEADEDIKAYTKKYGASVEYTNQVYALAEARANAVAAGYQKEVAASDAAMQKQINDAASVANAWYTALEVINGEVVNAAVGQRPGEAAAAGGASGVGRSTVGGLSGVSSGGGQGANLGTVYSGYTDPRVIGLMGMGYTAGEAAAIAGGYGGMISIPFGQRQTQLAQAGGLGGVNITINGTTLGSKDEIARVVGESLSDLLRRQGYTLPGR